MVTATVKQMWMTSGTAWNPITATPAKQGMLPFRRRFKPREVDVLNLYELYLSFKMLFGDQGGELLLYEKITKIVVVYLHPHKETLIDVSPAFSSDVQVTVPYREKTFEAKDAPLEVKNTDAGYLVIQEGKIRTLAVFKHWIYWENIK